jgi:exopolysaccharide biosynthesis predicted pyruvyltransferase EpsI
MKPNTLYTGTERLHTTILSNQTLPKTLDKSILHSAKNNRQTFYRQRVLCRVSKNTQQRKTSGKLRIKKPKKTTKHFLDYRTTLQPLPITILVAL